MDDILSYEELTQRVRELEAALEDSAKTRTSAGRTAEGEVLCREMIESLSELISRFSPEGTITFVNMAFCHHFDSSTEGLIGSNLFDLIPTEDHVETKRYLSSLTPHHPIGSLEHRMIGDEGKYHWYQCNYCAIFDTGGRLTEYQSVGRDVTDRKKAEKALRQSESKYRAIMDAMQDCVYICSPENRIEYMNRAMIDRIGRNAIGELCHRAVYNNEDRCPWCVFDRVAQGEPVNFEQEIPADHSHYSVSSTPIIYSEGGVSKLTIFRDITDLKSVEERLRQSEKMASLARLAGGIAHDFNNILMGINGYTELLMDQVPVNSEARGNLTQILLAGERAKRLIHQIVQFFRPEESNTVILDPVPVVTDVLDFMRSSLPSTVDIRKELNATNPIIVDKNQLSRIVMNLCTNAAHAMEETGGTLTISLADTDIPSDEIVNYYSLSQGAYVELKVSDTGHGMDPKTVKKIFDPYFTTKDKSRGAGMGLSIVHGIVAGVNGAIRVESQPGKGASFQVLIPAIASSISQSDKSVQKEDNMVCAGGECILFVDDEPSLVHLGRLRLEKLGYKVVAVTDPQTALSNFKNQPDGFSLVITDMTMPRLTGDKLARELSAIRPGIPIILCTGFNHRIDEETAQKIGIKALLNKPVSIQELAEVINGVLTGE